MATNGESEEAREERLRRRRERDIIRRQSETPEERDARYHTYTHTRTELVLAICLDWLGVENMTEIGGLL